MPRQVARGGLKKGDPVGDQYMKVERPWSKRMSGHLQRGDVLEFERR